MPIVVGARTGALQPNLPVPSVARSPADTKLPIFDPTAVAFGPSSSLDAPSRYYQRLPGPQLPRATQIQPRSARTSSGIHSTHQVLFGLLEQHRAGTANVGVWRLLTRALRRR